MLSDDSVEIYRLDGTGNGVKTVPFLYWRNGEVAESFRNRGDEPGLCGPEGRFKSLLVRKP